MTLSSRPINVFICSTSSDLSDYRAVGAHVIADLQWRPVMMEHFGAQPGDTVDACRRMVDQCDLLLLIVAWRRGAVPTPEQGGNGRDSITALELQHARSRNIPILALRARDTWPGNLWDHDQDALTWITQFRNELNMVAADFTFESPAASESERLPAFRALVKETLLAQKERFLQARGIAGGADYFPAARESIVSGRCVPIVGTGIYQREALSARSLASALLRDDPGWPDFMQGQLSLATVAQYRERFDGSRDAFLRHLRAEIEEESRTARDMPVLDLLAMMPAPVIVSVTYDRLLEDRLNRDGRKYAVVSHVIRSYEGTHDGSLLVIRPNAEPVICAADRFQLEPDETVIYKPQGSVFVADSVSADLEIDTMVVTEVDHVLFLQYLKNQETGVPASITRRFRRSPLLFLGYEMDEWQYRLMAHVFQTAERQARTTATITVGHPDSLIEEVAWKRLNADVIRMTPNEFANSVVAPV